MKRLDGENVNGELIRAANALASRGLVTGFGHVSARVGDRAFVITPPKPPGSIEAGEDLIEVSLESNRMPAGVPGEAWVHWSLYRRRPGVGAVCRAQPEFAGMMAIAGVPIRPVYGHSAFLEGEVPVHDRVELIRSEALGERLADSLGEASAIVMRGTGSVTVGDSVGEAVALMWVLENTAKMNFFSMLIGEPNVLSPEEISDWQSKKAELLGRVWGVRKNCLKTLRRSEKVTGVSRSTIWLELLGSGFREQFYDAGGIRTRVIEAGEGEPLLLLHGTGGHAETYQRNVAPLAKHFRVFALDMIGHGFTDRPDLAYSLDDYADHIVAFLDALGLERAHFSGESLGAMVAAWVAIRTPDRVGKIVMNTGILARPDEKGLAELGDLGQRTRALADDLSFAAVRRRMEWLVYDPEAMTDETVQCRYRIYSQPGMIDTVLQIMDGIQSMLRGTSEKDYFEPGIMKRISCPAMVLWTEHNPGQSAELARSALDDIPDAEFHLLSDCAHWPQFENPVEFNRLHVDFLSR